MIEFLRTTGAVTLIQHFGSALSAGPAFCFAVKDGVYRANTLASKELNVLLVIIFERATQYLELRERTAWFSPEDEQSDHLALALFI